ncbi:MAG: ATP-grasp fold amidoligase family protein [Hyphomicrobiales bacterium]
MSLLVEDGTVRSTNRSLQDAGLRSDPVTFRRIATMWRDKYRQARRESYYRHVDFGVIFESYIQPIDYEVQLFLFSGRFKMAIVFFREFYFENFACHIYDEEWSLRKVSASEPGAARPSHAEVLRPRDLFRSLELLCRHIDHVRADFLVSAGRYYFLEFTFTHNAGSAGALRDYDAELRRNWVAEVFASRERHRNGIKAAGRRGCRPWSLENILARVPSSRGRRTVAI